MLSKHASASIEQAVVYELQDIVRKYGATYASTHEAYAVLKEEVEEAEEDLEYVKNNLDSVWYVVKHNHKTYNSLEYLKEYAIKLAEEAVQCAAVCERFEETIKGGKA